MRIRNHRPGRASHPAVDEVEMQPLMRGRLVSLVGVFSAPVSAETRILLRDAWRRVPHAYRTANQFLGRQYAGCGATIGAMPRCDFACRGCYLGSDANRIPPEPVEEIQGQLRRLRGWLGHGGNLQLTDGELTLRPPEELIALIRYAREIGLAPMLMTHGDRFRSEPELLPRLVQAGLGELCIHVDTTQRGRAGVYRDARDERDLLPLRDELAALIRNVRRETGRRLEVATTFTVTSDNLAQVPLVLRWLRANADAFKMISFQPAAQVGRTAKGLGGAVTVDALWERIAAGLADDREPTSAAELQRAEGWLGHPACSRFVQGVVVREAGRDGGAGPVFHPLFRSDDPVESRALSALVEHLGGLTFRLDDRATAVARALGIAVRSPRLAIELPRLLVHWVDRFARGDRARFVARWLRGDVRVSYLNVVSHHFMSASELETPLGRERLDLCAFQVPLGDRLMSMCEVNARGVRDRYYAALAARTEPDAAQVRSSSLPIVGG
jgi:7,8-dihydro-6-hydroxymethylpterin dimethyltransferase